MGKRPVTDEEGVFDMRERISGALPLVLALGLVFALAGCAPGETENGETREATEPDALQLEVVEQWEQSGHSRVIAFAAEREECARCHDGAAFAEGDPEGEDVDAQPGQQQDTTPGAPGQQQETTPGAPGQQQEDEEEEAERDWLVSIDCRVCHTGEGVEIAQAGSTVIPGEENAQGGTGSMCMTCHNGRRTPDPQDADRGSPHYSTAADVMLGMNAMPVEGVELPERNAHGDVENTCVGCHMQDEDGNLSHEFVFQNWEGGCQVEGCHDDDPRQAAEDYDGDGQTEEFTAEIEGMLEQAREQIEEAGGGTFASQQGAIVFTGENGEQVDVDDDVYANAWNYLLISNDGSRGLHNPEFAVEVLRGIIGNNNGQ